MIFLVAIGFIMSAFIPIEFQKAFEKTRQTAIAITAKYSDSPNRLSSAFGGTPYWQADQDIPLDNNGNQLILLAQINFAEVPHHPDLPTRGLLQFFIPRDDEQYGANLDVVGADSRLITYFWENPQAEKLGDWVGNISEDDLSPIFGAHQLSFTPKDEYAGIDTIECAEALAANPFEVLEDVALNDKEEHAFFDAITEYAAAHGHKLLGYPYFVHEEPRENSDYRLLLQIDTDMDGDNDIMWGDNGVGQLFIRHDDLLAKRFQRSWLYWDY